MALVSYSESSSSESEYEELKTKRIKLDTPRLPLPEAIINMNNVKKDIPIDNPEEHEGRLRTFEHERGNWATYVYIPVNLNGISELQCLFIKSFKSNIILKESKNIHISLTKTLVVRHHWIDCFISSIRDQLEIENEFLIDFTKVNVYCNEDRTRTFIGLKVNTGLSSKLEGIMHLLNDILEDFKLEKFYEEPSFHASILWCVGDNQQIIKEHLPIFQQILDNLYEQDRQEFEIKVNKIYCKTGNKQFVFDLIKK